MAISYLVLFSIACMVVVALRRQQSLVSAAYRLLPALSLSPYLLHGWWTWGSVSGFGPPAQPPNGLYPGLIAFALFSIGLVVGLAALAVALDRRFPVVIALTPMVAGFFYWKVSLRLLYWQAPGFIFLDNVPLIWLFVTSVLSAIFIGVCGWAALVLPERSVH